jgi:hypothetical protein
MTPVEEMRALRQEIAELRGMLTALQVQLAQTAAQRVVTTPMPQWAPPLSPFIQQPNSCQAVDPSKVVVRN